MRAGSDVNTGYIGHPLATPINGAVHATITQTHEQYNALAEIQ
jgi:hypothetical protein